MDHQVLDKPLEAMPARVHTVNNAKKKNGHNQY